MKATTALAACFLALTSPGFAAIQLQPGEWQTTETGTEDGKPAPPVTGTDCLSPEDARDATNLFKTMREQMRNLGAIQCERFDVKQNGDTVDFVMKCGDPKQFFVDMTGSFVFVSATRYNGTMKSTMVMMGRTSNSETKIEAVRVGECKAGKK